MSTFYLLQIRVLDESTLKEYIDAAPKTVALFGGELVFRGRISDILSGQPEHTTAVVLKFPDQATAEDWYESEDYQSLLEIRDSAAEVVVTRYDESDFY